MEDLAYQMDRYRSRAGMGIANRETNAWRSPGFHAKVVLKITYAIIVSTPLYAIYNPTAISHWVERSERSIFISANDQDGYDANMARWISSMNLSSYIPGRTRLAAYVGPNGLVFSSENTRRNAYLYWQEELSTRVQNLTRRFSSKFPNWCRLAMILDEQSGSAPKHLIIPFVVRCNLIIKLLEMVVRRLHLSRGHISPYYKEKLYELEKVLIKILRRRFVSSVPSQSGGSSQENLSELPVITTPQSSHMSKRKAHESGEERPNKLMKKKAIEYIFSELRHESPDGESSKKNDHDDDDDSNPDGLDLSLRL